MAEQNETADAAKADGLPTTAAEHQQYMDNYLRNVLFARKGGQLLTNEKYHLLREFLKDPNNPKYRPGFRFWALKKHKFRLKTETTADGKTEEKIVVPVNFTDKADQADKTVMVTAIPAEELYAVIEDVHNNKLNHAGYKRVKRFTENHFFGVTRSFVQEFCRTCPICRINYPKNRPTFKSYPPAVKRVLQSYRTRGNHSPMKTVSKMVRGRRQLGLPDFDPKSVADIVTDCSLVEADSNDWTVASMKVLLDMNSTPVAVQCEPHSAPTQIKGSSPPDHEYGAQAQRAAGALVEPQFMARIQVDLIDMSASPDGDFHYICHMVDYFSKYRVLFPLKNNSSNEIACGLRDRVFAYFGPPKIIHMGTGQRFIQSALALLIEQWPTITIIQGKPSGTLSSEYISQVVKAELESIKKELQLQDTDTFTWSQHLAKVMFMLNMQKPDPTLDRPYGVVLGHAPHVSTPLPGLAGRIIKEEQLESVIKELVTP